MRNNSVKSALAIFLVVASAATLRGQAVANAQIAGGVADASGAAVAGAFVQMKNAERRLNFMVISQEQGKYSIDRLPAGKYVVQAIGAEHQSTPSRPVEVAPGKASSVDLSLTVERAPALPPAWPGRSPGERGAEAEAAVGGAAVWPLTPRATRSSPILLQVDHERTREGEACRNDFLPE